VQVAQLVWPQFDAFEGGEEIEERVARLRHEDGVARVGEQLEEPRVSLARARREVDVRGVNRLAACAVVLADGLARDGQAFRRRVVDEGWRFGERGEDFVSGIIQPRARRVRGGQVENWRARVPLLFEQPRDAVRFQTPFEA
jgi:hypothetical protein